MVLSIGLANFIIISHTGQVVYQLTAFNTAIPSTLFGADLTVFSLVSAKAGTGNTGNCRGSRVVTGRQKNLPEFSLHGPNSIYTAKIRSRVSSLLFVCSRAGRKRGTRS